MRWLSLLFLSCFAEAEKLSQWLNKKAPATLSKSFKVANKVRKLLDNMSSGAFYVIILPSDAAWSKDSKLYAKVLKNTDLAEELLLDAVVETDSQINSARSLSGPLQTIGATPIYVENGAVWFGRYDNAGNVKKVGKKLNIKNQPAAVLDDATVFIADEIRMPDDARLKEMRALRFAAKKADSPVNSAGSKEHDGHAATANDDNSPIVASADSGFFHSAAAKQQLPFIEHHPPV